VPKKMSRGKRTRIGLSENRTRNRKRGQRKAQILSVRRSRRQRRLTLLQEAADGGVALETACDFVRVAGFGRRGKHLRFGPGMKTDSSTAISQLFARIKWASVPVGPKMSTMSDDVLLHTPMLP